LPLIPRGEEASVATSASTATSVGTRTRTAPRRTRNFPTVPGPEGPAATRWARGPERAG
jgi:hypothetical protein